MDLNRLLKGVVPSFAPNLTDFSGNGTRKFPDGVVEGLMPLLGGQFNPLLKMFVLVYQMIGSNLGLDPTILLTFFGFFWAANKLWRQLYMQIYGLVQEYLMCNVHINSTDEMYLHMMKWLAAQPGMVNSRSLAAETVSKTAWEEEDEADVLATRISATGAGVYLNFSNQEAKAVRAIPLPIS